MDADGARRRWPAGGGHHAALGRPGGGDCLLSPRCSGQHDHLNRGGKCTGEPAEVYVYSDFGQPSGGSYLPYRFAGSRYDQETELYYVQARYYSPGLGRSCKPTRSVPRRRANLYAYVGNDPINDSDRMGTARGVSEPLLELLPAWVGRR